jgi:hypothetical protein
MEDAEEEVVKEKKLEEELGAGEEQLNPLALLRPVRRCNQRSRVGSVGSQSTENPLNSEAWGQSFKNTRMHASVTGQHLCRTWHPFMCPLPR